MKFKHYLREVSNKILVDVNEIMLAYYLAGENWRKVAEGRKVKEYVDRLAKRIDDDLYQDQDGRAKEMAKETFNWMRGNGFSGTVKAVWWTAQPNALKKATGVDVASKDNPSDVLIEFSNGSFLGVSAKSTKTKGDIGFKNPGVGSIDKYLDLDIRSMIRERENEFAENMDLPKAKKNRKKAIRDDENLKQKAEQVGYQVLVEARDILLEKLKSLSQDDLREHILQHWIDADEDLFPRYIKVTGHGKGGKYYAKVSDPLKNEKLAALMAHPIEVEPSGDHSVGVSAGDKRLFKMRFKYESQKLASGVKLSGDPWK